MRLCWPTLLAAISCTESLIPAMADSLPPPRFKYHSELSLPIQMRDGVTLRADAFIPIDAGDKLGTILVRTHYNKANRASTHVTFREFAGQGFVVVVEDVRGKWESEGTFHWIGNHSVADAYDTMEWITKQPWSNGKVATYGCSALGEEQVQASVAPHPAYVAMLPQAAGTARARTDGRYILFGWRRGGIYELANAIRYFIGMRAGSLTNLRIPQGLSRSDWLRMAPYFSLGEKGAVGSCGEQNCPSNISEEELGHLASTLPIMNVATSGDRAPDDFYDDLVHPATDPYFDRFDMLTDSSQFGVPGLHVNSWYDLSAAGTLWQAEFMRAHARTRVVRDNQYVIISPTIHCRSEAGSTEHTVVGERELGDARFPFFDSYLRWFRYWLNGERGAFQGVPHYQYFVMGRNKWASASSWPLPETRYTNINLDGGGHANSASGDGRLVWEKADRAGSDSFVSDPSTPVPSIGGFGMLATEPSGAVDQRPKMARDDVLIYGGAPLQKEVEVTGPIQLALSISSTAPDTDIFATLLDVYPDGRAFNITSGALRIRYRQGLANPQLMSPGNVYEVKIDLGVTSNVFLKGHRIALMLSSSDFPSFERNFQTGGDNFNETKWRSARNTIYHGGAHPSFLILPLVGSSTPLSARVD